MYHAASKAMPLRVCVSFTSYRMSMPVSEAVKVCSCDLLPISHGEDERVQAVLFLSAKPFSHVICTRFLFRCGWSLRHKEVIVSLSAPKRSTYGEGVRHAW